MSIDDLQRGGLTDPDGSLGKPVPSGHILVPGKIELQGDGIKWEYAGPTRVQEVSQFTLNEFVKLWDSDSAAILKFAKKWGVLVIIERKAQDGTPLYLPCAEGRVQGTDPIEAWKYYSRRACALLNIAAALRQGKQGDVEDWTFISVFEDKAGSMKAAHEMHRYGMGWSYLPISKPKQSTSDRGRNIVAQEVRTWLAFWRGQRMSGISDFSVQWNSKRKQWELRVDYHGFLFAALALQLALSIVGAESLYTCSGCGMPYVRELKRPKPNTANYCPKCKQKGIGGRRAVEGYRQRKAEVMRLAAAGTPTEEIAQQLVAPISSIKKWLSPTGKKQRETREVR